QIKESMLGRWSSIATEIRPSAFKNTDGSLKPFYLTRDFTYSRDDRFELEIVNFADPYGKIPLVKMLIKGHMIWQGDHPISAGAQKVDFIADLEYKVTPINQALVDIFNK